MALRGPQECGSGADATSMLPPGCRSSAIALLAVGVVWAGILAPPVAAMPARHFGPFVDDLPGYVPQDTCSPAPKRGVVYFSHMIVRAHPHTGSYGISRACNVGGTSEHKEGRAWDWKVSVQGQKATAHQVIRWLLRTDRYGSRAARARRLGIMYLIWNKRIWIPRGGWQTYCVARDGGCFSPSDGSARNPHTDHVHFSFTWPGAHEKPTWWHRSKANVAALSAAGRGLIVQGRNGGLAALGGARFYGAKSDRYIEAPFTGVAATASGGGYWMTTRAGRVYSFGGAPRRGGLTGDGKRVVDIAPTTTGKGYWLLTRHGRVRTFGDAEAHGDRRGSSSRFVSLVPTSSGLGYRLVTVGGGVRSFGDAESIGSVAGRLHHRRVVGAASNARDGLWLATNTGRVFTVGGGRRLGGVAGRDSSPRITDIASSSNGRGYWLVTVKGRIFSLGDASGPRRVNPDFASPTHALRRALVDGLPLD
jgi:hypothetical protein